MINHYLKFSIISLLLTFLASTNNHAQEIYSLSKAIETAVENSIDLQIERYNVDLAATEIIDARTRANINVENEILQFAKQSDFEANTKRFDPLNRDSFWKITKPIEWFGQRSNKIMLAEKALTIEESKYLEAVNNVYVEVANKWLEVWSLQKIENDLTEQLENLNIRIGEESDYYSNEDRTTAEVLRMEIYAKQFDIKLKKAAAKLRNAKRELGALLDVEGEVNIDLEDIEKLVLPLDLAVLIESSIENRPDYQSVARMMDAHDYNVKLQRTLAIPQPSIGVLWSNSHTVRSFGVTFAIDLPFFDRNQGEIQRSILMKKQAELLHSDLKDQIHEEVELAYHNYKINAEIVEEYAEILEKSGKLNETLYDFKSVKPSEIIESLEAYLEIRSAYYNDMANLGKSYIHLLEASGQLSIIAGSK